MENNLQYKDMPLGYKLYQSKVEAFLHSHGLKLDNTMDRYIGAFDGNLMVAGAGSSGHVIKCVAVDYALRGQGVTNTLVGKLLRELYDKGHSNVLLFTKPENQVLFNGTGFTKVEEAPKALLMESKPNAFPTFLRELAKDKQVGKSAAIVMNCNPFTLGHQYLVETAAAQCDTLHIFVVQEDLSSFPYTVRKRLVEEGTRHLANVRIHDGGNYIISTATFPDYFLKTDTEAAETQAELDLRIFARHIAPALGITTRFVGEEPFCDVTGTYNKAMAHLLPASSIAVKVIPRKAWEKEAISASRVRDCVRQGALADAKPLVPDSTWRYLTSAEAEPVIEAIRKNVSRH